MFGLDSILNVGMKLIDKLTQANANISTWETYINKEKDVLNKEFSKLESYLLLSSKN